MQYEINDDDRILRITYNDVKVEMDIDDASDYMLDIAHGHQDSEFDITSLSRDEALKVYMIASVLAEMIDYEGSDVIDDWTDELVYDLKKLHGFD